MNFIVYAPPYTTASGGVQVLYDLCAQLNKLGHHAEIIVFNQYRPYDPESIVIYPEVIPNNPLNAARVVRYFLHLDGYITGIPVTRGPNDFIMCWSKHYYQDSQAVLYKYLIYDHFNDTDTKPPLERNIDCTWVHKGARHSNAEIIQNSIHIGANGPLTKKGLADLLRQTRILYSYDILTAVVYEAIFCGAFVVPLLWKPFNAKEIVNTELDFPWVSINNNRELIIPLDYAEKREKFIKKVYSVNKNYSNTLESIVQQIKSHFQI